LLDIFPRGVIEPQFLTLIKPMASSKEYLEFILEQLSSLDKITYRPMMGEYIIYYREIIVGGLYDDRLLVKPAKSVLRYIEKPIYDVPYEGGKKMLLILDVDNRELLGNIFNALYDELLLSKPPRRRNHLR